MEFNSDILVMDKNTSMMLPVIKHLGLGHTAGSSAFLTFAMKRYK